MVVETGLLLKLPSLAGFNLSLMNTGVPLLSLSVLPPRQAEDAPEVDLFLTIKTFTRFLLMLPRVQQSSLPECLPS